MTVFFDTLNSGKESELAYANWYAQLPDDRKARMMADMFQFGVDTVIYNARKNNPFMSNAEGLLHYMEATLKDRCDEHTFSFITQKMEERAEEEWKRRFRQMKKKLGWDYEKMAAFMGGVSADALKASLSRKLPAFAKLAVCVFEEMAQEQEKKNNPTHSAI